MPFQVLFYCGTFPRVGQDKTGHLVDFCALTLTKVTDILTRFIVQLRKSGTSLERCWYVAVVQSLPRFCYLYRPLLMYIYMTTGYVWSHCYHHNFHETGTCANPRRLFWMHFVHSRQGTWHGVLKSDVFIFVCFSGTCDCQNLIRCCCGIPLLQFLSFS